MENMYTAIAMLNRDPESLVSLGTFKNREDAQKEIDKAVKRRVDFGKDCDYYFTKILFNYFG